MSAPAIPTVALLLAAGQGSRFGGDKLLHPLRGVPLAAHAARNLRAAGLPVVAVVKPGDEALAALLNAEGCTVTVCPDAGAGMGHSLAHGVSVTSHAGGWIVALADMPAVKPATIARIVDALHAGASLAAPFLHGERGHPVGFAAHHRDALLQLAGDVGARSLMQAQRNALVVLDVDDPGVLYDVDRRDDLARPV